MRLKQPLKPSTTEPDLVVNVDQVERGLADAAGLGRARPERNQSVLPRNHRRIPNSSFIPTSRRPARVTEPELARVQAHDTAPARANPRALPAIGIKLARTYSS